jgi:hypothetical protein
MKVLKKRRNACMLEYLSDEVEAIEEHDSL